MTLRAGCRGPGNREIRQTSFWQSSERGPTALLLEDADAYVRGEMFEDIVRKWPAFKQTSLLGYEHPVHEQYNTLLVNGIGPKLSSLVATEKNSSVVSINAMLLATVR